MIYHVLNGDCLAHTFKETSIAGEVIITREALIDGDLSGDNLNEFWKARAGSLGVSDQDYEVKTVQEFNKILNAAEGAEFNLWFEYDLLCQVNLWFILSLINSLNIEKKVFIVYATHLKEGDEGFWNGFGTISAKDLDDCFAKRVLLSNEDILLGANLWAAYKVDYGNELTHLAQHQSPAFPYLKEVVSAQNERNPDNGNIGKPEQALKEIIDGGITDFPSVFEAFKSEYSIYGFGDTQLKKLYDNVIKNG